MFRVTLRTSRLAAQPATAQVSKRGFAGPPPNSFFKGTPHERPPALNPERSDLSRVRCCLLCCLSMSYRDACGLWFLHTYPHFIICSSSSRTQWLHETARNLDAKTFTKHVLGFAAFVYVFTLPNRTPGMLGPQQPFVERPRDATA